MKLLIDIRSPWHAGTGRGSGSHLDALVRRDPLGLPLLPGRSLKGLLRDAVYRASQLGWYGPTADGLAFVQEAFGTRSGAEAIEPEDVTAGRLRVGDACLREEVRQYLRHPDTTEPERAALASTLVMDLYSTAMDETTGVALSHSLRGIEVAVPLMLEATLDWQCAQDGIWREQLRRALPLLSAVGSQRSRGFGRARVTLEEHTE